MARIRTIKPEFPQSESMGRVSREARLTFVMLWTIADDAGRLRGNSRMLASLLFPYDDDAPNLIDGWLDELSLEGCVTRYTSDGAAYVQIDKWLNHQKIDRPSPSKIPEPTEASRIVAKPREHSSQDLDLDQGSRIKEGIKDRGSGSAAAPRSSSEYAFAGKVIRLSQSDLDKWRNSYSAIPDLDAELQALDDWIVSEPAASQKKWFHLISGALKKRHTANAAARLLSKSGAGLMPRDF